MHGIVQNPATGCEIGKNTRFWTASDHVVADDAIGAVRLRVCALAGIAQTNPGVAVDNHVLFNDAIAAVNP